MLLDLFKLYPRERIDLDSIKERIQPWKKDMKQSQITFIQSHLNMPKLIHSIAQKWKKSLMIKETNQAIRPITLLELKLVIDQIHSKRQEWWLISIQWPVLKWQPLRRNSLSTFTICVLTHSSRGLKILLTRSLTCPCSPVTRRRSSWSNTSQVRRKWINEIGQF